MKISAFTFGFNLIEGGYPVQEAVTAVRPYVDEVVAVDCQSTDNTRHVLRRICHKVIDGPTWEGRDIQHQVFELHRECKGDVIIMFEADEVYEDGLLGEVGWAIERGHADIGVWRIQVEQNFQRVRGYPMPVHRVFPRGRGSYREHPTNVPDYVAMLPPNAGFLWDCSNCFKENYYTRKQNQAKVWGEPRSLMVARHFTEPNEIDRVEEENRLNEAHWLWTETPLRIPPILRPLVGQTKYNPRIT